MAVRALEGMPQAAGLFSELGMTFRSDYFEGSNGQRTQMTIFSGLLHVTPTNYPGSLVRDHHAFWGCSSLPWRSAVGVVEHKGAGLGH